MTKESKKFRNDIINQLWSFGDVPDNIKNLLIDDDVEFVMQAIRTYNKEQLLKFAESLNYKNRRILSDEGIKISVDNFLKQK